MDGASEVEAKVIWHDVQDFSADPLEQGWTLGVKLTYRGLEYGFYRKSTDITPLPDSPYVRELERSIAGAVQALLDGDVLDTGTPQGSKRPEPFRGILRDFGTWLEEHSGILGSVEDRDIDRYLWQARAGERRRLKPDVNINAVELRGMTSRGVGRPVMLHGPLDMELESRTGEVLVIRVPVVGDGYLRFQVASGAWEDKISIKEVS